METEIRFVVTRHRGRRWGTESPCFVDTGSSFGVIKIWGDKIQVSLVQHREGMRGHKTVHFKFRHFMLCESHLNNIFNLLIKRKHLRNQRVPLGMKGLLQGQAK